MYTFTNIYSKNWQFLVMLVIAGGFLITSCDDNSAGEELGSLPDASFTATPLSDNPNKIVVESTTEDAFMWKWEFGNGVTSKSESDTVTYINQGDYTIELTAFGQGGSSTATQQINIASDYQGENVLPNDGALTSDNWTFLATGGNQINVTFENGNATFTNTPYSYGAIYVPVQVEASVEYIFSAQVEGSGMGNESWFEIYMGTTEPSQGSDYTDNKFVALNTYVPCGGSPFDGDVANIGCDGSGTGEGGIVTFSTDGTIYLVVKAGSNNGTLGEGGVTLTSISLAKL